jgi:hypothetical protein
MFAAVDRSLQSMHRGRKVRTLPDVPSEDYAARAQIR